MRFLALVLCFYAFPLFSNEDLPGSCRKDDEFYSSEEGGCLQFKTGFVMSLRFYDKIPQQEAVKYCDSLNEGGKTDWVLPTSKQLRQLSDSEEGLRSYLRFSTAGFFWTSGISSSHRETSGIGVIPATGETALLPPKTEAFALCVRVPSDVDGDHVPDSSDRCNLTASGKAVQKIGENKGCAENDRHVAAGEAKETIDRKRRETCLKESRYFKNANGGCEHQATRKTWSGSTGAKMTWAEAKRYCANLNQGSGLKWRLPAWRELEEISGKEEMTALHHLSLGGEKTFWSEEFTDIDDSDARGVQSQWTKTVVETEVNPAVSLESGKMAIKQAKYRRQYHVVKTSFNYNTPGYRLTSQGPIQSSGELAGALCVSP